MHLFENIARAGRRLAKNPGFTLAAVITLALGIGANTTLFSLLDAVVLRPLPYPRPSALVTLRSSRPDGRITATAPADFLDWQHQAHTFQGLAAHTYQPVILSGGGEPVRLRGERVTADFFAVLGVRPALGRAFLPAEDRAGGGRVTVLSHGLWLRRFGGNANILGQTVRLDSQPATIVGVMPRGFGFPSAEVELWVPMAFSPDEVTQRGSHFLSVIGRLAPGASLATASAEMRGITSELARQNPQWDTGKGARLVALHEQLTGGVRPALLLLFGAVSCVLLIACANVANLLLGRAATRRRDVAILTALGASRARLLGETLSEGLVLGLAGGLGGVLLALWGTDFVVATLGSGLPRAKEIGVDLTALGFTFGLALGSGILVSLLPALLASRAPLFGALKAGGRTTTGGPGRWSARNLLVVLELTLAAALLIGAGLLLASFSRLLAVDPGFRAAGLVAGSVGLPDSRYPAEAQMVAFYDAALDRLRAQPGVSEAALVNPLPLSGGVSALTLSIVGRPAEAAAGRSANWRTVSPGYFHVAGIPLLAGRAFSDRDRAGARPVLIINQTMARRDFPGENALGKQVKIGYNDMECEVVGVVGDVHHEGLDTASGAEMYTTFSQTPWPDAALVVRVAGDPRLAAAALRNAVRQTDPEQAVSQIQSLDDRIAQSAARPRFVLAVLTLFAGLALLLAAIGLYGVMAWSVGERTHEIGIRMALGARRSAVSRMVVGQGAVLVLTGTAAGLGLALALSRLLAGFLFGVSATDPRVFLAVPTVLVVVGLVAAWLPATRATRVDPQVALQAE